MDLAVLISENFSTGAGLGMASLIFILFFSGGLIPTGRDVRRVAAPALMLRVSQGF
jgi:hypothetical protein